MNTFLAGAGALVPSIGVGAIFYLVMRFIVRADRNERAELARLDEIDRAADRSDKKAFPADGT